MEQSKNKSSGAYGTTKWVPTDVEALVLNIVNLSPDTSKCLDAVVVFFNEKQASVDEKVKITTEALEKALKELRICEKDIHDMKEAFSIYRSEAEKEIKAKNNEMQQLKGLTQEQQVDSSTTGPVNANGVDIAKNDNNSDEASDKIKALTEELHRTQKQLAESERLKHHWEDQNKLKAENNRNLAHSVRDVKKELVTITTAKDAAIAEKDEKIKNLETSRGIQTNIAKANGDTAAKAKKDLNGTIQGLEHNVQQKNKEVSELREKLVAKETELEAVNKKFSDTQKQAKEARDKFAKTKAQCDAELNKALSEFKNLKDSNTLELQAKAKRIAELENNYKMLTEAYDAQVSEAATLKYNHDEVEAENKSLEDELSNAEQKNREQENTIKELKSNFELSQQRLKDAEKMITDAEMRAKQIQAALTAEKQIKQELRRILDKCDDSFEDFNEDLDAAQGLLDRPATELQTPSRTMEDQNAEEAMLGSSTGEQDVQSKDTGEEDTPPSVAPPMVITFGELEFNLPSWMTRPGARAPSQQLVPTSHPTTTIAGEEDGVTNYSPSNSNPAASDATPNEPQTSDHENVSVTLQQNDGTPNPPAKIVQDSEIGTTKATTRSSSPVEVSESSPGRSSDMTPTKGTAFKPWKNKKQNGKSSKSTPRKDAKWNRTPLASKSTNAKVTPATTDVDNAAKHDAGQVQSGPVKTGMKDGMTAASDT